ncbi:MAG TPA: ATP-binding protein [Dongiaceae bacterium]|nr:ATP-binding protein [Dongiaceae bacterium]
MAQQSGQSGTSGRWGRGLLPRFSTQVLLGLLMVLLLGPGLGFTGLLLWRYATSERDRYALEALATARQISSLIDRDLNGLVTTLGTLTTSTRLPVNDLAGFRRQAEQVARIANANVILRAPDGRELFSTIFPREPSSIPADALPREGGGTAISDVYLDAATGQPVFAIEIPVVLDGELRYLLALQVPTSRIASLLTDKTIGDWIIGIGDRSGTYVTRVPGHQQFTGKPGVPAFLVQATEEEGNLRSVNPFGDEILAGYAHSALSGWLVAASVPVKLVEAPLREEVTGFVIFGAVTLAISVLLVVWLWHVASRPLTALAKVRSADAETLHALNLHSPVREIHDLADALLRHARARDAIDDELRRNEARLRAILDTVPIGVVIADKTGEIRDGNRRLEEFIGPLSKLAGSFYSWPLYDAAGRPVPEHELPMYRVLRGEAKIAEIECLAEANDGTRFWIRKTAAAIRDVDGTITGGVASIVNIDREKRAEETLEAEVALRTEELASANRSLVSEMMSRQEAEQRVRQLQKMEAIGHLSGGIAHDFNNMLAIVLGALNLLERRVAKGEGDLEKYVAMARDGANRAANLTKRLLAFSRQQALSPVAVDANKLIAGMSDLLRRTLGAGIQLETVRGGGLWLIHVDTNQLESAILNLALNARDAMENMGGETGKLTIETGNYLLDESYTRQHDDVPPGQYVMIAVTDTGTGMAPEIAAKAFDPFFTTKGAGKGTGLGLSMVYGFVKQSGGHVKIYSEPGHGTTIKIYLPRFYGAEEATEAGGARPVATGDGRLILLVEDEDHVRQLTAESLRELGYRTLTANDAAAALRLIDANPDIALLFTDIVMPDMNGRKLADEALKRRPGLPILFTTGFSRNAVVHNGVLDPGVNFLAKPFTLQQLAEKIREALARG